MGCILTRAPIHSCSLSKVGVRCSSGQAPTIEMNGRSVPAQATCADFQEPMGMNVTLVLPTLSPITWFTGLTVRFSTGHQYQIGGSPIPDTPSRLQRSDCHHHIPFIIYHYRGLGRSADWWGAGHQTPPPKYARPWIPKVHTG